LFKSVLVVRLCLRQSREQAVFVDVKSLHSSIPSATLVIFSNKRAYGPFSSVWYKNILYKANELGWIRKKALKNADRTTFLQMWEDKCLHQDILPWIDNDCESFILYLILLV
jgi:hypothetical protein